MAETNDALLNPAVLARLANTSILARRVVEGFLFGLHRSLYHGFGSEFVHYRNYAKGDDLKYVDWKLYAKSNRLHTKVFQEETNTACYIVLDVSASMGYTGSDGVSKLAYARMLAACLAYLMHRQGDQVGLFAYGDTLKTAIPPSRQSGHLPRLCAELEKLRAGGESRPETVLRQLSEHFDRRGLVIFISDLWDSGAGLFRDLKRFRVQHHDCLMLQVLTPDEVDFKFEGTVRFVDSETASEIVTAPETVRADYQQAVGEWLAEVQRFARQSELDYQRLMTNEPLATALGHYLNRRASFK